MVMISRYSGGRSVLLKRRFQSTSIDCQSLPSAQDFPSWAYLPKDYFKFEVSGDNEPSIKLSRFLSFSLTMRLLHMI